MSSFTKSIVYSGIVLAAGLVAVFAIYSNMGQKDSDYSYIEPASGSQAAEAGSEAIQGFANSVQEISADAVEGSQEMAEDVAETAEDTAEGAVEAIEETAEDAVEATEEAIENAADTASETAENATEEAENAAESVAETAEDAQEGAEATEPASGEAILDGIYENKAE
jgi:methyl-accepting chemotaxis protein